MDSYRPTMRKRFVSDGVLRSELNELFTRELRGSGFSGLEVRKTPSNMEVVLRVTRVQEVIGEKGRRIRELQAVVQKRFSFPKSYCILFVEWVKARGLSASAQAESVRYKLVGGLPVHRACYGVLRYIMVSGAAGCVITVSGKLRNQRAKTLRFTSGFIKASGHPTKSYVDTAIKHVTLQQGVIGIMVKIVLQHDPTGKNGPSDPLPDDVTLHDPDRKFFHSTAQSNPDF